MDLQELTTLRETWDFEAKLARGQDGQGRLPDDFWPTYSAMANTHGGQIVLGVKEKPDGSFRIGGIADPDRVEKQLWDLLDNPQKVSVNLLDKSDVVRHQIDGKTIIIVSIPRASRTNRPVYIKDNFWTGTYLRLHEGDHRVQDRERIRRMVAESTYDSRDDRILEHFTLEDIHPETLRAYRRRFQTIKSDHPWIELADGDFLCQLGALKKEKSTGAEGLTPAGLLMFGKWCSILDHFPNYQVDYLELREGTGAIEWDDRIVPDGVWSGNVFDFYRKVINKLLEDLPVPFQLRNGVQRIDETHVHQAVREGLVNALIHADYEGRISIQIIKRRKGFDFRNPGTPRVSIEQIRKGGTSDCRNRTMQKLFRHLGLGEEVGSGFSRILRAWREQTWRPPLIEEDLEHDTTVLQLSTESLLPTQVVDELTEQFGERFTQLSPEGRTIVATALLEKEVDHARLSQLVELHSRDLTLLLQRLVRNKFLEQDRPGRGCSYHLVDAPNGPRQLELGSANLKGSLAHKDASLVHKDASLVHKDASLVHKDGSLVHKDSSDMPDPGESTVSTETDVHLSPCIQKVRESKRASQELVRQAILVACQNRSMTSQELAELLNRNLHMLFRHYLRPLVKEGRLELLHPEQPKHPKQAYRAATSPKKGKPQ